MTVSVGPVGVRVVIEVVAVSESMDTVVVLGAAVVSQHLAAASADPADLAGLLE